MPIDMSELGEEAMTRLVELAKYEDVTEEELFLNSQFGFALCSSPEIAADLIEKELVAIQDNVLSLRDEDFARSFRDLSSGR